MLYRWRLMLAGAAMAAAGSAFAQDAALGRVEYMANCAQCHGIDGRGDGVIAGYLTTPPSDLTTLASRSGGALPKAALYATIEGGRRTGPHGTREMPAWGDRYSVEAAQAYGFTYTPAEQAAFIHRRIEALLAYLATIQEP
jgi:mono/diheme cytochrome c family protein